MDYLDTARDFLGRGWSFPVGTTRTQMEQEAQQALVRWEPRITDVEVHLERDPGDDGRLLLHVSYVVRSTNNPYNLVYPYYINEGLEG